MTEMQSTEINELMAALSKAQGEMKPAVKDNVNPHFRAKFADLTSVWEACREPLAKNGLAVAQTFEIAESGAECIITTLGHSSGQWMRSRLPLVAVKRDPQGIGSAITYMRRYALQAIVGVSADDDDGNAASTRGNGANDTPKPNGRKPADPAGGAHPITTPRNKRKLEDVLRDEIMHSPDVADLTALWKQYKPQIDEVAKDDKDTLERIMGMFGARRRELEGAIAPETNSLALEIRDTILASETLAEVSGALSHYEKQLSDLQHTAPGAYDEIMALADQMRNEIRLRSAA